jgi:hypothetical protein
LSEQKPTFNPIVELNCLHHRAEDHLGAEAKFWDTEPGILRSIHSVGEHFAYKVYNNATHVLGDTYPVAWLIWTLGKPYDTVCPKCIENSQKGENGAFRPGWFLPQMPVHLHCKCTWELLIKKE